MAACPQCGDDTHSRKVSAVYNEQTGWHSGGSQLGRLLTPPRAPYYAPELQGPFGGAGFGVGLIAGFVLGGNGAILAAPLFGIVGGIVGMIVGDIVEGAERDRLHEQFRPLVDEKKHVWEGAYYCSKHDVVFPADLATVWTTAEFSELITVKR